MRDLDRLLLAGAEAHMRLRAFMSAPNRDRFREYCAAAARRDKLERSILDEIVDAEWMDDEPAP